MMKNRYDDLRRYLDIGDIKSAAEELNRLLEKFRGQEVDDEFAVLAATVAQRLGDEELAYGFLREGLLYNGKNAMLYFMLGNYYEDKNVNQAWLCYENAEYYGDAGQELAMIRQRKRMMENSGAWSVNKVSIVVLTYNLMEYNIQCIQSLKETLPPGGYELVVVDNASSDGTAEWLEQQTDIRLIRNERNMGFPYGCNQGIKAAGPENDIILLNNDTIVLANAVFWLRMGLYEEAQVGAAGSSSNVGMPQMSVDEYIRFGQKKNVPEKNPYQNMPYLGGFALLIKRKALDETGLLDLRFSPGQGEDVDYCMRLQLGGWRTVLCQNSFIIHYVHGNGKNRAVWKESSERARKLLREKWGVDMHYYCFNREDIIGLIHNSNTDAIRVLEIGCGCGATLNRIKYLYPDATVSGIELIETVAGLGAVSCDIRQGNIETMELPYERETFDYIIMGDVVEHLRTPEAALRKLVPYLKENGKLLCSIPNLLYWEVIADLLRGKFEYQDEGILDRTHLRFFTLDSIEKLMQECGLKISEMKVSRHTGKPEDEYTPMIDAICRIPGAADREQFLVYQYIFSAERSI